MNHRELVLSTKNYESALEWMMSNGFIEANKTCANCNVVMNLENNVETKRWRCWKCKKSTSPFENTILFNSNKNIVEILDLIYFWSLDLTQNKVRKEANTKSCKTVCRWYKTLSVHVYNIMITLQRRKIGGVGHTVEVDESKFSKRKYNVGRSVRSPWVVGGVDLTTGEVFFVEVLYRNSETLSNILLENIEVGTTIITDCWAGYVNLEALGFIHLTVNHSENFVDPLTGANTQAIENRWSVYKRKFRSRSISYNDDLIYYFAEFMFKIKYKEEVFTVIMRNLNKFY